MQRRTAVVFVLLPLILRVFAAIPNVKEMPREPLEARIAAQVKEIVENQTKALRLDFKAGIGHLKMEMTTNFDLFFSQLNQHTSQLKELSTQLKLANESMVRVSARLSSLENEGQTKRRDDDAARKAIALLTSMLIPVRIDLARIGQTAEALSHRARLSSSDHRHFNASVETMTSKLRDVASRLSAASRRCQQGMSTSKTLTARLKTLDTEFRTLNPVMGGISAQMTRMSSRIRAIEGMRAAMKSLRTFIGNHCGNNKENKPPASNVLKQDVLLVDSPTCTRFNKVTVPIEAAAAVECFHRLKDVPDIHRCSTICAHNHKCLGFRYSDGECKLLHSSRKHVEAVSSTLVDVWLLHNGGLGQCSEFFNVKYRTSKYRLVANWKTWEDAKSVCHSNGGKLAELTSRAEIHAMSQAISTDDAIFVGGVQIGGDEPAGGWMWYQSRIRIPSNGFRWAGGQPSNMIFYDEDALIWDPSRNRFHDARYVDKYQFLCECYPLTW